MTDRFGLQRMEVIVRSGIRSVFTPSKPVDEIDLLVGRSNEVARILDVFTTPGQHALVFGERGVGKSSLANVTASIMLKSIFEQNIWTASCARSTVFEDLVEAPLRSAGIDLKIESSEVAGSAEASGGVKLGVASVEAKSTHSTTATYRRLRPITPNEAAEVLAPLRGLLVIDEADALEARDDKMKIAELIKLLSDRDSRFRVMVVGIAQTANELTGAHPSVQRCIREVHLGRISDPGLAELITQGGAQIGLSFDIGVVKEIVYCSDGYPFFAHLLALKSGEEAIADGRTEVTKIDLATAMVDAAHDSEGSLQNAYASATRSSSDMYRTVLYAASLLPGPEFTSESLRLSLESVSGERITQGSLNNYLQRLVDDRGTKILLRVKKGMYRFTDPRMAAHVRIVSRASLTQR